MSIKEANLFFKEGNYEKALSLYKKVIIKSPSLEFAIKYNIKKCEHELLLPVILEVTDISIINPVKKILEMNLDVFVLEKNLPELVDIKRLLDSVSKEKLDTDDFQSILKCTLRSPFQKDLLLYVYQRLCKTDLKTMLNQIEVGFNIATMLKFSSEVDFWLLNRYKLKTEQLNLYKQDQRFFNLITNGPNDKLLDFNWEIKNQTIDNGDYNSITAEKTIAFGTILLNEQKFIGLSLYQHYNMCNKWVLVEGTCLGYPTRKVTEDGFSKDKSSALIKIFPDPQNKIKYIAHGWTSVDGEDAKSELRNQYLKEICEDYLVVIDADEFYLEDDLKVAFQEFENPEIYAITLPQVHFWKNTDQYITGEYYDISHTRIYRNYNGMKYIQNHNFPELNKEFIHQKGQFKFKRTQLEKNDGFEYKEPRCYHMGFAKDYDDMRDKSDYYVNRGEDVTRKTTTDSRAAWFDGELPEKCRVKKWSGELPEVLSLMGEV